ncbi:MAG TPA: D-aminoacyl-tRNA deacylase [Candidatus Thalassarchaeaceae archaeon]|nr:D-aminoacyl-tRNA deacylase [Candidatus Thalassarchaeaceae archaeon]HJM19403.1 D-aminoacyl-tRNA deacylase [Candidatus Thalassarchaeaceae archaeon]HJM87992.1 D-aminoacyl-tRNA deacylase [Candidatus Thalassarchaeaceae archaeon]
MVTLLIISEPDIASTIQGDALLRRGGWDEIGEIEGGKNWSHQSAPVHMWWFPDRVLWQDNLDMRYSSESGEEVHEVIFLSRHFAASGMPSLTLHVIGVPGESPIGEPAEYGGRKGEVVLPNTRFASWYRRMCQAGEEHGLIPEFDLTIETTHHGPILSVPTMFIEIGSSESHWAREDAAEAWADVMTDGLGLNGGPGLGDWSSLSSDERRASKVMLGIGGGHYAPRHTDVLKKTKCWAGHQLASYALEMEKPEDENWNGTTEPYPLGQWAHSIKVSLESTKIAFPEGQIIAHLDRKSFKGWQRQSIKRLCEELDLPIGRTHDFD